MAQRPTLRFLDTVKFLRIGHPTGTQTLKPVEKPTKAIRNEGKQQKAAETQGLWPNLGFRSGCAGGRARAPDTPEN